MIRISASKQMFLILLVLFFSVPGAANCWYYPQYGQTFCHPGVLQPQPHCLGDSCGQKSQHERDERREDCRSGSCDQNSRRSDKTAKGLGIGAVLGAVLGGLIGRSGESAAIGAGAGALFGGILGHGMDRDEELACQREFLGEDFREGRRYDVRNSQNYYVAYATGYYYGYPQYHCRQYQYFQYVYGPYGASQQFSYINYCYFQQGWQVVPEQYFVLY